ncbi:MAG: flagellar biosynthesis protein FlhB [Chlorobi bacterium]|jgi:flagellar biosynthetic protein FlhB|nr:flagellar biosynthesis protein FlhB [Chlorobiota bacterium]
MPETPDGQERTEEATPKRLSDARERGQVAKSMELTSAALLLLGGWFLYTYGAHMGQRLAELFRYVFRHAAEIAISDATLPPLAEHLVGYLAVLIVPLLAVALAIGLATEIGQVGLRWASKKFTEGLKNAPLFHPMTGLRRIFLSKDTAMQLGKNLAKVLVVGIVVWDVLRRRSEEVLTLMALPIESLATTIARLGFELVLKVSLVYAAIAIVDFLYQRRRFRQEMKMTKQEVKDELKQQEGDTQIKQRIRQIARQRLRKLMLQRVKTADVVVTNPTHYAVALLYERGRMNAPRVVAKGVDYLAQQIRTIAEEHNVPIVEDPPLARALYSSCDIDDEIPETLFRAVARVLAYVYRLRRR